MGSNDSLERSTDVSKSTVEMAGKSAVSSGADLRRRLLLRGGVAAVPVVMTLRSGMLAASSCVAAKVIECETDASGTLTQCGGGSVPASLNAGDACVTDAVGSCPGGAGSADQLQQGNGSVLGVIEGNGTSTPFKCTNVTSPQGGIAILSGANTTSLIGV